jgi:putative ABC transport system permease protein
MITELIAKKYFGDQGPMNKAILLDNNNHAFKITGTYKSFPSNPHLHPEILMSFNTLKDSSVFGEKQLRSDYYDNNFFTYLLFPKNYNVGKLEARLPTFLDKYVPVTPGSLASFKVHQTTRLELQKLSDIHLRSHLDNEIEENGDINRVYTFSAIALFILLIACINYMNLSTARSGLRAKEIGIRKVIGDQRKEIIGQFLSESVLITWMALVLAIILNTIFLPLINKLSNQDLSITGLLHWVVLLPAKSNFKIVFDNVNLCF